MAFIWVQYYGFGPLPTIFENPMGDIPVSSSSSEPAGQARQDLESSSSQYQQPLNQQRRTSPNPNSNMAQPGMPFNMTALAGTLPNISYAQSFPQQPPHSQQQFPSAVSTSAIAYHLGQATQFGGQQAMNHPSNPAYNMQYQQFQGPYSPHAPQSSIQTMQHSSPQNQHYFPAPSFIAHQQSQQSPQFFYPSAQYAPQNQAYQVSPQHSIPHQAHSTKRSSEHLNISTSGSPAARSSGSGTPGSTSPSVPRGPPRKPKQSGNALWVGNLPTGARVEDLKDHFSRDATDDIESVFLISKSNCAFVNYKTEASCAAAMARFHESRFQNVRLVCRLRRQSPSPAAVAGVPTGPAALTSTQTQVTSAQPALAKTPVAGSSNTASQTETTAQMAKVDGVDGSVAKDKYFIVKSLTMEDLEMSVRNNIWATQSHNEEALNKAYETADHVYLIFSANKSGEYFGYARMASPINDDPAAAIEFAPKAQLVDDPDLPKAIPTPATEFAPKGRIIDDSARGTIFWEAESPELEPEMDSEIEGEMEAQSPKSDKADDPESAMEDSKAWGKPFKLEWISTNRLPFYRTRGLRNPWNSNREVKIARDGTELETSVGRRLIQMFHRNNSPVAPQSMQPMLGPGYPQMRFQ